MSVIGSVGQPSMLLASPVSWTLHTITYTNHSAGFDYEFHAIHNEDNELFVAYKDMFEMAISQGGLAQTVIAIYFPFIHRIFVSRVYSTCTPNNKNSPINVYGQYTAARKSSSVSPVI